MRPDDSFSPPLDGLSRGKKIHQILTTLSQHELVENTKNIGGDEEPGDIGAVLDVTPLTHIDSDGSVIGILTCNWWHMRNEPDWWKFEYSELGPDSETEHVEEDGEERLIVLPNYRCEWMKQENNHVEGQTYFREMQGDQWHVLPFDPRMEAPRPLTRELLDSYIPFSVRWRHP